MYLLNNTNIMLTRKTSLRSIAKVPGRNSDKIINTAARRSQRREPMNTVRKNIATHPELNEIAAPTGARLSYTYHATVRARLKGCESPELVPAMHRVVEFETVAGRVVKLVIRFNSGRGSDTVLVIRPITKNHWRVITAWTNSIHDHHDTLDVGRISV